MSWTQKTTGCHLPNIAIILFNAQVIFHQEYMQIFVLFQLFKGWEKGLCLKIVSPHIL